MISIIIPFYNRYDLIMKRMMEIHSYIHHPNNEIEILMVNNGSDPRKIEEGNIYYWQKMVGWFSVRYVKWETNIGFGGAMNRGVNMAKGDTVVLLSDDVMISGDFIPKVTKLLEQDPTFLIGGEIIWWPGGWNEFEFEQGKVVVPYANGWFLSCKKEMWKKSGGFDPLFSPYDYEDMDLSTRWHEMDCPIVSMNSSYIRHIGGATISTIDPDRMKHTEQQRQKYIAKWSDRLVELYKG